MVMRSKKLRNLYAGLEVEIIRALAVALNFSTNFYQSADTQTERWGKRLSNGSYTGLIGEIVCKTNVCLHSIVYLHLYTCIQLA